MELKPLSNLNWNDFASLMQSDAQCSDCWCLNHHIKENCPTGLVAKEKMKALVDENNVNGFLAYKNDECIGWIAIDPMSRLNGHDCQTTGQENEWAIHCMFVKNGFRGQGFSVKLIQAAIDYARNKGAKIVSAFPIPTENLNKFPKDEAEFSGRFSTYSKLGFEKVGSSTDFYQRMELR